MLRFMIRFLGMHGKSHLKKTAQILDWAHSQGIGA